MPARRAHPTRPVLPAHHTPNATEELDTLMDLELTLDAREAHGKANKRLRRAGLVPGVVFGKGEESTPVQIDAKIFETLYRQAGRTSVVNMHLPGKSGITSGIIKSVQRNPLSGRAIHVDFFLVNLTQEMELDVPLVFHGEAPAVEETGGTLLHNLSSLHVKALPNDIPQQVVVDVSVLRTLDVAIHVRDLSLNRDLVHVLTDGDTLVATVVPPRIEEEPEPILTEEELEAAALAEAEGAEGAEGEGAPAEGGEATPAEREESAES
jgi:large subunit ribosomal protein L25